MRTTAGYLFMSIYQKPPLSHIEILERLNRQGLHYAPTDITRKLSLISYHRLSAYFSPFYMPQSEQFQSGMTFAKIWQLYEFDRLLRHLVSEALEPIEIAFRTAISESLSHRYGAHWFLNADLFKQPSFQFKLVSQMKEICSTGSDTDIQHYMNRYQEPSLPPSWLIMEKLSFGACVNIFRYLKLLKDKKAISQLFEYHPTALESWFESLRYTRNLCAHHERLWNRWFVWVPKLEYLYRDIDRFKHRFYAQSLIINRLLKVLLPEMQWLEQLYTLMNENADLPFQYMGFQMNWKQDILWKE